jgi:CheY-like chemotaxis protein
MQILHNLLSNALKFTERGRVGVTIGCRRGDGLSLEVSDTGIGMTAAEAARLYDDFVQADSSVTRRFGGTGLGMAIVRRLVSAMGGTIGVRTAPGAGTTVRIDLPLPQVAASAPVVPVAPDGAGAASEPVGPTAGTDPLAGIRVLAADDNEINRLVLDAMLANLGVGVTMVHGGAEAVAAAAADDYDLLLLDISMPGMDGVEALGRIRDEAAAAGRRAAPAIAVTANALTHQIAAYLAAGFVAHLAKPLRPEQLRLSMIAALDGAGGASALPIASHGVA